MAKNETISVTYLDLISGEKLLLQRARLILPYLVRQAKAGRLIYYSDLTAETGIPNPRNLNYPLGAVGNGLISLGKKLDMEIPPIQCLVINKATKLPGEGIGWFISQSEFKKLSRSRRTELIKFQLTKIFAFPHWNRVLDELNLKEINNDFSTLIEKAKAGGYGGGESQSHRTFKEALAKNPKLLRLNTAQGELEYRLPSADCIDVLFTNNGQLIAVEAKSIISADDDILRGLFQCIKYKHLIEAEQIITNREPNSRVILALQGKFPTKLLAIKNMLDIEVFEKIQI